MSACTLLILTYKGKHHLEYLLPTVKDALKAYRFDDKLSVLIVDNGRDAATRDFVNQSFPEYRYEEADNNYLFSINEFTRSMSDEFVFILNDDIRLDKDILNHLIPFMKADESLFAVTCKFRDWDDTFTASGVRGVKYTRGWMHHYYIDKQEEEIKYTMYPSGGGSVFRTKLFNAFGGFDDLYRPGYCEDTDLGIRAWQQNYKVVYYPKTFLFHREGGTMNDYFKNNRRERMIYKNYVLWNLKNVRHKGFLFWFFVLYPFRLITFFISRRNHFHSLVDALSGWGAALKGRFGEQPKVRDEDWMPLINTPYIKSATLHEQNR